MTAIYYASYYDYHHHTRSLPQHSHTFTATISTPLYCHHELMSPAIITVASHYPQTRITQPRSPPAAIDAITSTVTTLHTTITTSTITCTNQYLPLPPLPTATISCIRPSTNSPIYSPALTCPLVLSALLTFNTHPLPAHLNPPNCTHPTHSLNLCPLILTH